MSSEFISGRGREEIGHELYMLMLAYNHNPYPNLHGTFEIPIEVEDGVFVVRPFKSIEERLKDAGPGAKIRVVSDVDGTLGQEREGLDDSVPVVEGIDRAGWQNLMIPIYAGFLVENTGLDEETAVRKTLDIVQFSMGKPTAVQTGAVVDLCHQLMEKSPLLNHDIPLFDPVLLKKKYTTQLEAKVEKRRKVYSAEQLRIAGPCELLERFKERGYRIIVGSGTDVEQIRGTMKVLGLSHLVDDKDIYAAGGKLKPWQCAKRYVMQMLLAEGVPGELIFSDGDGRPEISEAYNVNGIAAAIATPSICRYNPLGYLTSDIKRDGLIKAGATLAVEVDNFGRINVDGAMKVIHQGVPEKYTRNVRVLD